MNIICVANRLPVTIKETITLSSGGLVAAIRGAAREREMLFVGWPGGEIPLEDQPKIEATLFNEMQCIPVYFDKEESEGYYDGLSNSTLWPLLHNMPRYMEYTEQWFNAYVDANRRFAEAVVNVAHDDDLIWVHDYQLFLVPQMIKKMNNRLRAGFFLHTPFPSYELFRCHPKRAELLKGVLGADLIGFHTFGYLRHFRSAILRILGIESNLDEVVHDGFHTRLGVFPIGIDTASFKEVMETEPFKKQLSELQKQYDGRHLVLSVERLDYSKGILKRLKAIELFLKENPLRRAGTIFVLIAVPSREEIGSYRELKEQVELSVGHINGQYATVRNIPINFINHTVSLEELAALYTRADVALVTPLIDGMNLVAKEYLACKEVGDGVLILSEFAGAAQELFSALMVNPHDIDSVSRTIEIALDMKPAEREARMLPMRSRVLEYNAARWATDFLDNLERPFVKHEIVADFSVYSKEISTVFRATTGQRYLFLDYDGTLCEFTKNPDDAVPSLELVKLFEELTHRSSISTVIISGRNSEFLDRHFSRYNFTLVAEHGYMIRRPGDEWVQLNPDADQSWKAQVEPIMQHYALSTPGSSVEEKRSAIVWHYRKADPEFGVWKANHLLGELAESINNLPVEIHHGKCIVEVSSQQISKGFALRQLLKEGGRIGAAVCIGDDQTDETMFWVTRKNFFTIKVGPGSTAAATRIEAPRQVREFLAELISK